jgi:hypothetical protein
MAGSGRNFTLYSGEMIRDHDLTLADTPRKAQARAAHIVDRDLIPLRWRDIRKLRRRRGPITLEALKSDVAARVAEALQPGFKEYGWGDFIRSLHLSGRLTRAERKAGLEFGQLIADYRKVIGFPVLERRPFNPDVDRERYSHRRKGSPPALKDPPAFIRQYRCRVCGREYRTQHHGPGSDFYCSLPCSDRASLPIINCHTDPERYALPLPPPVAQRLEMADIFHPVERWRAMDTGETPFVIFPGNRVRVELNQLVEKYWVDGGKVTWCPPALRNYKVGPNTKYGCEVEDWRGRRREFRRYGIAEVDDETNFDDRNTKKDTARTLTKTFDVRPGHYGERNGPPIWHEKSGWQATGLYNPAPDIADLDTDEAIAAERKIRRRVGLARAALREVGPEAERVVRRMYEDQVEGIDRHEVAHLKKGLDRLCRHFNGSG